MNKVKKTYRVRWFFPWNISKEIDYLNKKSQEGLQLIKGGRFLKIFEKNPEDKYIYQIDDNSSVVDINRYIDTFKEQGWEHINSTIGYSHFFRKKYYSNIPKEESEIYTNREEVFDRWIWSCKLGIVFILIEFSIDIFENIPRIQEVFSNSDFTIYVVLNMLKFISILNLFIYAIFNTKRVINSREKISKKVPIILCIIYILCKITLHVI